MATIDSIDTPITACISRTGLSRAALARRLGVTPGAVSHWATGRHQPRTAHLVALARLGGVSLESLISVPPDAPAA